MIQKTTDYSKFKTLKANRSLSATHLARLTLSISRRNMLEQNPIIVNENMEVIDGQHRLEVARLNHWAVYYTVVPDAGIDEVMEMNANLRTWKLIDYVDSLITRGYKDMQYIKEFADAYDISISDAIITHNGVSLRTTGNPSGFLSRMTFSDPQKELAVRAVNLYGVVKSYKTGKGKIARAVLHACRRIAEEGKDKKIADAIALRGKVIAVVNDAQTMYELLRSYVKSWE